MTDAILNTIENSSTTMSDTLMEPAAIQELREQHKRDQVARNAIFFELYEYDKDILQDLDKITMYEGKMNMHFNKTSAFLEVLESYNTVNTKIMALPSKIQNLIQARHVLVQKVKWAEQVLDHYIEMKHCPFMSGKQQEICTRVQEPCAACKHLQFTTQRSPSPAAVRFSKEPTIAYDAVFGMQSGPSQASQEQAAQKRDTTQVEPRDAKPADTNLQKVPDTMTTQPTGKDSALAKKPKQVRKAPTGQQKPKPVPEPTGQHTNKRQKTEEEKAASNRKAELAASKLFEQIQAEEKEAEENTAWTAERGWHEDIRKHEGFAQLEGLQKQTLDFVHHQKVECEIFLVVMTRLCEARDAKTRIRDMHRFFVQQITTLQNMWGIDRRTPEKVDGSEDQDVTEEEDDGCALSAAQKKELCWDNSAKVWNTRVAEQFEEWKDNGLEFVGLDKLSATCKHSLSKCKVGVFVLDIVPWVERWESTPENMDLWSKAFEEWFKQ
jgi:hypothetical protein